MDTSVFFKEYYLDKICGLNGLNVKIYAYLLQVWL